MEQFKYNLGIMTKNQFEILKQKHILIIGLGGLGGYVAHGLVRMGVHQLTLIDYDRFDKSNLNRQLFSNRQTIGSYKVDVLKEALLSINPNVKINIYKESVLELDFTALKPFDLVIDALDDIIIKCALEGIASTYEVPLLHGAIGGWYGQLGISLPHSNLLRDFYGSTVKGLEETMKNPAFTPAVIANMMVSETVKYFLFNDVALNNKIFAIDLFNHTYQLLYQKE